MSQRILCFVRSSLFFMVSRRLVWSVFGVFIVVCGPEACLRHTRCNYFVDGFERPLLVLGDAVFAGSMGKCASPALYRQALDRLHDVLDPLPDDVVLLPGHGPATTLGQERADATHLALLEGGIETWPQLLPYLGKIELEILEVE